ncbi:glycosyl hydrolase 115 family protein [Chryseosolibacter indicus]|uniref:Glycosyl hydrolase 115 family protein n=1 Tax=Chryseosolibacter indicus TaxID=2782351 RepID=A0ABS5VN94_9BACT|nr:glycosyl hydrolase 115 family protein [Chryseosolibacter indicus]MBT1702314.1 glycosyl hydrolase 115 family protein [Chryseosolibacter indicus]
MRIIPAIIILLSMLCSIEAFSVDDKPYVTFSKNKSYFPFAANGVPVSLYVSDQDYSGVVKAVNDLRTDVQHVTGKMPALVNGVSADKLIVLVGTIGKSPVIDELINKKKLVVSDVQGKWETFIIETIEAPMPGVERALVIAGSDKRGTIFGVYDLAQQIGVSPWSWWADVPVDKHKDIYILPGRHTKGEPAVKYRGIFINDEQPALGGWVRENFGGFNSKFYVKVFELILRLKGNFLWPAMWGQSFYTEDPLNPKLADEYGVVISTSHHEPMMRAHVEWQRSGKGKWDYNTNDSTLREFWREGIRRMGNYESIVTLAMRGDGDEPMSEESNISLLQRIVNDQRQILNKETGKDVSTIPQVWALYKEVQEYYDRGMRVPEDVTLLLCDDNWGNLRKLPNLKEKAHPGGYGIYYHYDYVGGPRNYKWLNTNPIQRVWEQMHLAHQYGVDKIWIVNVGDIKPMEFPIEFFLDYAWSPDAWPHDKLQHYTELRAEREFGRQYAKDIADIMTLYTKYNGRRKPELLGPDSFSPNLYSLINYREAERIVEEYNYLAVRAQQIYDQLPKEFKDAYYQLILYPVKACANLNELYYTVRLNHLYAKQGRALTNELADRAERLFAMDAELTKYYNEKMASGKWNHMMDQHHIGYKGWHDDFGKNIMPEVKRIDLPSTAGMAIAIEGSEKVIVSSDMDNVLPALNPFDNRNTYVEIFNRGSVPFEFTIDNNNAWVKAEPGKGKVDKQQRIIISVDWSKAPKEQTKVPLKIKTQGLEEIVYASINNVKGRDKKVVNGFVEANGYVSIEAEHFKNAVNTNGITWQVLPGHGRTLSGVTPFPVNVSAQVPGEGSPQLHYPVEFTSQGKVTVYCYFSPTIDFKQQGGLKYAIGFDNEVPRVINVHENETQKVWGESVKDNIRIIKSEHNINTPGLHTLKFMMVDPALVLQKIVIDCGGAKQSYLGPPESFFNFKK